MRCIFDIPPSPLLETEPLVEEGIPLEDAGGERRSR
jgi:hypothetical protein